MKKKNKKKNKTAPRIKKKKKSEIATLLREVDLYAQKTHITGFRVPPMYKHFIRVLGKLLRTNPTYGKDLSESAVIIKLILEAFRRHRIF